MSPATFCGLLRPRGLTAASSVRLGGSASSWLLNPGCGLLGSAAETQLLPGSPLFAVMNEKQPEEEIAAGISHA